ncbi:MAG: CotH kinase family protein [Melioribacteraceae bacterium]|nr:CotH kinase family protein [Melioribacteraceae bacterium]
MILLNTKRLELFIILFYSFYTLNLSQEILINEFMPSNSSIILDNNGNYSDWLELFNSSDNAVDLKGYGLSDNINDPFKWTFPSWTIQPHQFLLLFASGESEKVSTVHWETIIDQGDQMKYQAGNAAIPAEWNQINFVDASWQNGASGFGYGDNDDATVIASVISVFTRKVFYIDDAEIITEAVLHIDYDDSFVAYLNGTEIARSNIGVQGEVPSYNQTASNGHEANIYRGLPPDMFKVDSVETLLKQGANVLAIQVHNLSSTSSDLTLIPFLTLGMSEIPPNANGTPEILKFNTPHLHTNFKIDADGESLILTAPDNTITDSVSFGSIPENISYGRLPDGGTNWMLFYQTTPGYGNNNVGYNDFANDPLFSHSGGFYNQGIRLSLSTNSINENIRYTLDGSDPDANSLLYSGPIQINSTTVVKAKTFGQGLIPSGIVAQTYLVNEYHVLPVFSISSDPKNFFDTDSGIYVMGKNYQGSNPYYGANFWQDWERPVHVEFFEPDGEFGFSINAGAKILGGWSRAHPQKALGIFARSKYGDGEIDYQLFPDRPFQSFESFVLRNCGNDWGRTFYSDAMMQGLVENIGVDGMAYRPCVVYINGEYWGILNLREKQNEHYIADHFDIDPDSIDLLELNASVIHGDAQHYNNLINYVSTHNLAETDSYEYVKTQMDMDNYIDYNVAEIYFDNRDWPGNNIKYWRPKTKSGKWRWLLYDTDWGFGINAYGNGGNQYVYDYNTLQFALSPTKTPNHHGNEPWSTLLLRRLVQNPEFRNKFINRFCDYFNTIFSPGIVVDKILDMKTVIEPEMLRHAQKWSEYYPDYSLHNMWWSDIESWNSFIEIMIDFGENRIPHMMQHIRQQFNLDGSYSLTLGVIPEGAGTISLNSLYIDSPVWSGEYFSGVPLEVKANPNNNYEFIGWQGISTSENDSISVELEASASLTAVFGKIAGNYQDIVINEINYNSHPDFDTGDWLELYNNSNSLIDISNWKLMDSDTQNVFIIPSNVSLNPHNYIVICRDTSDFSTYFPRVTDILGEMDFGFDRKGDQIRLFNDYGELIDSLNFGNRYPWPAMPDGGGSTLELKNPGLDNLIPHNWSSSGINGTPGSVNNNFIVLSERSLPFQPEKFLLFQNYPNPFNPVTKIRFTLPESQYVSLKIYNIIGQEIKTLINGEKLPGSYEVQFNGSELASGVYIYNLIAGKYSASHKMILLK